MTEITGLKFTYLIQPPKKYTFEQPELLRWTVQNCRGAVLNLFAGKTPLGIKEYRVDIDASLAPDHVGDAHKFILTTEMRFDTIILDPPYNLRKAREKYNGGYVGSMRKLKADLARVLNPGGRVISFGFDSVGMGARRGFEKVALCVVCHNGDHNDTICLVEGYVSPKLIL